MEDKKEKCPLLLQLEKEEQENPVSEPEVALEDDKNLHPFFD